MLGINCTPQIKVHNLSIKKSNRYEIYTDSISHPDGFAFICLLSSALAEDIIIIAERV